MGEAIKVSLKEIKALFDSRKFYFTVLGDEMCSIAGFSSLDNYKEGTITWIKSDRNGYPNVKDIQLIVVQEGVYAAAENQIISRDSKAIFFSIIEHFFEENSDHGDRIGKNTVIGGEVILGENTRIGNNCSITGKICIGDDTTICDNVVIKNNVAIGKNCYIQSLSVIGEDGFGYSEDGNHKKVMVKHHGGVYIGNDVFIGSHVNIARGTIDDTYIADGVKIAPSTHIGHNNYIGQDATVICSQSYGSVHIGDNAYVAGSIIRNQCVVGNNTMVGMGSVVTKDVPDNKVAIGIPARILKER